MNKFKVGDRVRCTTSEFTAIEIDSEHVVSEVYSAMIYFEDVRNVGFAKDFFELVERGYRAPQPSEYDNEFYGDYNDQINNPSHYQIMPGVEVIHVHRALLDKIPAGANLNAVDEWSRAWEYLTRAWSKNGLEDFKKAQVYLGWLIERLENE